MVDGFGQLGAGEVLAGHRVSRKTDGKWVGGATLFRSVNRHFLCRSRGHEACISSGRYEVSLLAGIGSFVENSCRELLSSLWLSTKVFDKRSPSVTLNRSDSSRRLLQFEGAVLIWIPPS